MWSLPENWLIDFKGYVGDIISDNWPIIFLIGGVFITGFILESILDLVFNRGTVADIDELDDEAILDELEKRRQYKKNKIIM